MFPNTETTHRDPGIILSVLYIVGNRAAYINITVIRPMKFLAYYTGPSKSPYHYIRSLKTHSYRYRLLRPAYHIAHHVESLFNSRYFPTGKGTMSNNQGSVK